MLMELAGTAPGDRRTDEHTSLGQAMTTYRHRTRHAMIELDGWRLTKQERERLGLPDRPSRRKVEPPPFPDNPGAFVWFALTTTPRGEAEAAVELDRLGFAAFNPTEVVVARASRQVKFKREARERAMFTSTVLAGFPGRPVERRVGQETINALHADVPWLTVLGCNHVLGFVGMGAKPLAVPLGNVIDIRGRCGQMSRTRNWSASVGDAVEISTGAWVGQKGEVVELTDGRAMVRLFGKGVFAQVAPPLSVPETWLEPTTVVVEEDQAAN